MERFGLRLRALSRVAPRLIYCSLRATCRAPTRTAPALDEVVQMMGGLAYMTGPIGRPMRAGASVNDVMGGMFGVIAIQAALAERQRTGRGRFIQSALFENNVFLMGQAMMYETVTGQKSIPYSVKDSPWPVYDLFDTKDGTKIFVSIVGEEHWSGFCNTFGREAWLTDARLATNQGRVDQRSWIIPEIAGIFREWNIDELSRTLERLELPFAPVNTPGDLFDDPHLAASGGLVPVTLPDGKPTRLPALPLAMDGARPTQRHDAPSIGADGPAVLAEAGMSAEEIDALVADGIVVVRPERR